MISIAALEKVCKSWSRHNTLPFNVESKKVKCKKIRIMLAMGWCWRRRWIGRGMEAGVVFSSKFLFDENTWLSSHLDQILKRSFSLYPLACSLEDPLSNVSWTIYSKYRKRYWIYMTTHSNFVFPTLLNSKSNRPKDFFTEPVLLLNLNFKTDKGNPIKPN